MSDKKEESSVKRLKRDEHDETDLDVKEFIEWCNKMTMFIDFNKVKITRNSTSHHFGMIAVADINKDEILAKIPKKSILEPNTTDIKELLMKSI